MNAQDAVKKLNKAGGNYSTLSAGEIYDIFRALQGSFAYSDELNDLSAYAQANGTRFFSDAVLQDKILSEVNTSAEDLDSFNDMYQAVSLFTDNKTVKNKFATEAYKVIENYSILNTFSPDELDAVEGIAKNLKKDIDNDVIKLKANEKKAIDKFITKVDAEIVSFVKANDLENVHTLDPKVIDANLSLAENLNAELENSTGIYADKIKDIENFLSAVEVNQESADEDDDELSSEKFRQEIYDYATEEALRKCALDPNFASLPIHEQKLAILEAKKEAVEEYIRKTVLADAIYEATEKFNAGEITAKDKKDFEKKAKRAFEDFKGGATAKITVSRRVSLHTIANAEKNNKAIGKYIAIKTGFTKFFDRAKARWNDFEEKYPKTAKWSKVIGKAALKGGAVFGASLWITPLGSAVSAGFAAQAAYKSWKDMKRRYKEDPAYQDKKFGAYLKDHKMDAFVSSATALSAAVAGSIGVIGFVPGVNIEGTVRRMVRGSSSLTVGLASGVKSLVNAKTSKERKLAWGMMGVSSGIAAVSMFFGDDIAKFAQEKFGGNGTPVAGDNTNETVETVTDNSKASTDGRPFWKRWLNIGEEETESKVETEKEEAVDVSEAEKEKVPDQNETPGAVDETKDVDYSKDYARDFDPETAEKIQSGSYRRSLEYTRTHMQEVENERALKVGERPIKITEAMATERLNEGVDNLKLFSPELVAAAASRGISPEEIYNLAHMEELQFDSATYLRSYSETLTLSDGSEYRISSTSMAAIAKGNCHNLTIEEQLKVIDHARSHYDMEHGGKVIAQPKVSGDEWRGLDIKAGIKLNGCGNEDSILYENIAKSSKIVKEVIEEETIAIDNHSDIVVSQGEPIIEKEEEEIIPAIEESNIEEPKADAPQEPEATPEELKETPEEDKLHEVIGTPADNFTPTIIGQGFIPSDSGEGLDFVGKEEALNYWNDKVSSYSAYSNEMIESGWAVPMTNVHMVTGDGILEKFNEGVKSTDVFPVKDENGNFKWYMAGGGDMHQKLAEKFPKEFGESYREYQGYLKEFGTEDSIQKTGEVVKEDITARTSTQKTVSANDIKNMKKQNSL